MDNVFLSIYTSYELDDVDNRITSLLKKELIETDIASPILGQAMYKISPDGEAFLQHHTVKTILTLISIILPTITAIAVAMIK